MSTDFKSTPMMEQWQSCKKSAQEAVLLFRMGDFYEAFHEDAQLIAEELDLTLTKRQGIPMSGVPWHSIEPYIDRLVNKGYRVAIAEQVEDPKQAKGLVRREIVRFVTPGTQINLTEKTNNFICGLSQVGSIFGLATLDLTTATFQVTEMESERELFNELYRLHPSEIVISKKMSEKYPALLKESVVSTQEEWKFDHKMAYKFLTEHFQLQHLDGFGLKGMVAGINAGGALLSYIHEELSLPIGHIRELKPYSTKEKLSLDRTCQRNLELADSLLKVIDQTETPMGGRLLCDWMKKPLLSVKEITARQDAIEAFYYANESRSRLKQALKHVRDLERLMMKISAGYANPRDLLQLRLSLEKIGPIKILLDEFSSDQVAKCREKLVDLSEIINLLTRAIVDEPPIRISDGKIFRDGFHPPLDELREITRNGKAWLARYQTQICQETGIKNLKVSFNKIFGYYIEVSKGQAHLMPESFQRRQTLVNSERFISPVLKEYENKVLSAEDRIQAIENELFQQLREKTAQHEREVFQIAISIAQIDVLANLAEIAKKYGYCRPLVDESETLEIIDGRHPVVEAAIGKQQFIPNDTTMEKGGLMLITGPNMAGKSTYIRQVALIVIMAQMGGFVPATRAHIGIVDKIFTRIGASDDLSRGQSTFMVEMSETANILHNVTSRSLVILDEIGRGTSTYDGVSIAWAVAEFLLNIKAKTLFATHYWELTELPGVMNYQASVQEWNDEIIFLHKIAKGGTDKSYGIHVARLAGLPRPVIQRAESILKRLEKRKRQVRKESMTEDQLSLF